MNLKKDRLAAVPPKSHGHLVSKVLGQAITATRHPLIRATRLRASLSVSASARCAYFGNGLFTAIHVAAYNHNMDA
jgi:hypothetical protein